MRFISAITHTGVYGPSERTGADKFTFIKVSRLPRGVDAKELWQIEARLQFGKDFRLAYAAVNEFLKLRAGLASKLTFRQIEKALGGRYTEKQLKERIEVLKLIDKYLEAIGKKGHYHKSVGNLTDTTLDGHDP